MKEPLLQYRLNRIVVLALDRALAAAEMYLGCKLAIDSYSRQAERQVEVALLFEVVEHFGLDRQPLTAIEAPLDEPRRVRLAAQLLDLLRAAH